MKDTRAVLVTGASRGIGRAIALALAQHHPRIGVVYAGNEGAAQETVSQLSALGAQALAVQCDVADSDACRKAVAAVHDRLGPIGILVNNAGLNRDGLALRMPDEDFDRVLAVNLRGAFLMIRACMRDLMQDGAGRIVNIASVSGLMGNAGQANYAASKAGLIGLTKSIARELAPRQVTCNAVAPGFIETDMTRGMPAEALQKMLRQVPLGRIGSAEEVAAAVAFLCSDQARYITGAVLQVDGGLYM